MRNDSTARRTIVGNIVDVVRIEDVDAAAEVIENIASIAALPLDVLPAGPARDALFRIAEAGHDVNVYQPMSIDRWTIWVRPAEAWMEGRYSPQEWQAAYAGEVARILGSTEVA